ncbi:MAG: outer membrane lipoprotein-sorting protein, partial [Gloeobacteraceae cyanobacterium ES-bin-144]|nr:outer membrane lipoprotein-sorting protein [Verrucomicrobiales bacterium]
LISCVIITLTAEAAETPPITAKDLAAKLSALQQDGSSLVRLKMVVKPPAGTSVFSLQLQIKQRRTRTSTEVVYQVLWPKERAGEAVLLRQSGNQAASGFLFTPPNTISALKASQMKDTLFGSDLSYADVLENFFAWENQTLVGTEVVGRVTCQILESKPGKGQRSEYSGVRTWVDIRRVIPLRIEKSSAGGALVRRFETTDVATDDLRRSVPANLTVSNPQKGSATDLDGSKLKHDVVLTDRDFTPEGMR